MTCTLGIARTYNETRDIPNESGCCFYHGYHNCVVGHCQECEDVMVAWDHLNHWWVVVGTDEPHEHQGEPPEHFAPLITTHSSDGDDHA